ncbi:hypothetical protein ACVXG8_01210 [Escherichia coli]
MSPCASPTTGVVKLPRAQVAWLLSASRCRWWRVNSPDDLPVQGTYVLEMAAAVVQMALVCRPVVAVRLPVHRTGGSGCPARLLAQHPPQSVVAEADNFRRVEFSCGWRRLQ